MGPCEIINHTNGVIALTTQAKVFIEQIAIETTTKQRGTQWLLSVVLFHKDILSEAIIKTINKSSSVLSVITQVPAWISWCLILSWTQQYLRTEKLQSVNISC